MSTSTACPPLLPSASPLWLARAAGLVALLLAEVVGLTLAFDMGALADTRAWWAQLLVHARWLPQIAAGAGAAALLFGRGRLRAALREAAGAGPAWPAWPFLLAHLAAFAGLARVTAVLLGGAIQASSCPEAWALGWLALAGLTLGLWAAAFFPVNLWPPFVRRGALPRSGGLAVGLLAWGAGQLTGPLWTPLGRSTFWAARGLLGIFAPRVVCRPDAFVLGTPTFAVEIAPACSGYEGIGLIWVFLAAYLWVCRKELRFPAAMVLLPLATAAMWLANVVRIAALIAIGVWGAPAVAMGGFHSQAGWLGFNAVALGLVVAARRSRVFSRREDAAPAAPAGATAAYLVPLLALVGSLMITTAASGGGFDWFYPVRVLAVAAALWCFRKRYAGVLAGMSWRGPALGAAAFVLWLLLEPAAAAGANRDFGLALRSAPAGWAAAWLAFRVAGSVLSVPLAEELAFRGYLLRRLGAAAFDPAAPVRFGWLPFLLSSVLFGLLHGRWVAGVLAGALYAATFYRRGRLADAVAAHAVTNALIAVYVLATGSWSMWT